MPLREATGFWSIIDATSWNRAAQQPLYALLARIVDACNDQTQYDLALQLLVQHGSISAPNRSPMRPVVTALSRAGIIQATSRGSRTYLLKPQYQSAIEVLRRDQI